MTAYALPILRLAESPDSGVGEDLVLETEIWLTYFDCGRSGYAPATKIRKGQKRALVRMAG